jgi:hypothetical protein
LTVGFARCDGRSLEVSMRSFLPGFAPVVLFLTAATPAAAAT